MPDYLDYRKSISNELISIMDRVQHFIGGNQWPEIGRFKENILIDALRSALPNTASIATGFIMGEENHNPKISSQIDIIIYKSDYPLLFKYSDFAIVPKECVLGIIEVKTTINSSNFLEIIKKNHEIGQLIGNANVFNGVFAYKNKFSFSRETLAENLNETLIQYQGYVNNICFGKDYFMKSWRNGNPRDNDQISCYSFYKIKDLSFGYFISNLVEDFYNQTFGTPVDDTLKKWLYPIEGTKEDFRLRRYEIKLR